MPRLVRVVPAAPAPPAVLVAHRAPHRIAHPAGIKYIGDINVRLEMRSLKDRYMIC
jgi:hypothetical protein